MNEYTCESCKNTYEKGWTDEEANIESVLLHGKSSNEPDMAIICDDCFIKMRKQGLF
mgnify:CR=1|jgi:hypothetical protein